MKFNILAKFELLYIIRKPLMRWAQIYNIRVDKLRYKYVISNKMSFFDIFMTSWITWFMGVSQKVTWQILKAHILFYKNPLRKHKLGRMWDGLAICPV